MGCMVFEFDPHSIDEKMFTIQTVVHDPKCSRVGTPEMEKKYGTRAMMLGAIHCVKELAETRWPKIIGFALHDQGTYKCQPLDMHLKTSLSDLFLMDNVYYERHLNMKLEQHRIQKTKIISLNLINSDISLSFDEFWRVVSSNVEFFHTVEKANWLNDKKAEIKNIFDAHRNKEESWRTMFAALHSKLGCSFFAATLMPLARLFKMVPLIGACYVVNFDDLPKAKVSAKTIFKVLIGSGGGDQRDNLSMFPIKKIELLREKAESLMIFQKSCKKYTHPWNC